MIAISILKTDLKVSIDEKIAWHHMRTCTFAYLHRQPTPRTYVLYHPARAAALCHLAWKAEGGGAVSRVGIGRVSSTWAGRLQSIWQPAQQQLENVFNSSFISSRVLTMTLFVHDLKLRCG